MRFFLNIMLQRFISACPPWQYVELLESHHLQWLIADPTTCSAIFCHSFSNNNKLLTFSVRRRNTVWSNTEGIANLSLETLLKSMPLKVDSESQIELNPLLEKKPSSFDEDTWIFKLQLKNK
jgi:predicted CxxxxCH...CXXCH cytochrome family protein